MVMALSKGIATSLRDPQSWKKLGLPALLAMLALAVPVAGALALRNGEGIDGVNFFVESLSGNSSTWLGGLGLAFAFAAGMVSAVNPCGAAMLPAYLGLYLGGGQNEAASTSIAHNLGKAVLVGSAVTGGFVVLFGVAGGVISLGANFVVNLFSWLGLAVGIVLALGGAWMVGGGKLYTGIAARAASKMGDPGKTNVKGYFIFGLSYGTASLSCTLPIFLGVVGATSLTASSLPLALSQYLLYALGMGFVILVLTIGMAIFKQAMVKWVRKAMPYVQPVGAWFMIIAGAYLVFYWLTIGGLF